MFFGAFAVCVLHSTPPVPSPSPGPARRPAALGHPLSVAPEALYSLRARRRFAAYLRLRLLEMREAGLERAAGVVERRLPLDVLLPHP